MSSPEYVAVPLMEPSGSNTIPVTLFQVSKPKKSVEVPQSMTVAELKTEVYPDEVAAGKRIRFIHSGSVLSDSIKLEDCGLTRSQFIHVAITDNDTALRRSSTDNSVVAVDDDDEDQEAADRRLAIMLSEREDGLAESELETFRPVEGDASDFIWGFVLSAMFGYLMIIFLWQPRISRRQRLGIICGMTFFAFNNLTRTSEQVPGASQTE